MDAVRELLLNNGVNYFVYGPNMNEENVKQWLINKGYEPIKYNAVKARIEKATITFNYYSTKWYTGAANMTFSSKKDLWGLILQLTNEDYDKIKSKEDPIGDYYELELTSIVEGTEIKVKTFKVKKEKEENKEVPVIKDYLNLIIKAAEKHEFPLDYVNDLKRIEPKELKGFEKELYDLLREKQWLE